VRRVTISAVRDYILWRIAKLERIILSEKGPRRQEARKERAFLKGQITLVYAEGEWQERLDPELLEAVRQSAERSLPTRRKESPQPNAVSQPAESAEPGAGEPSYRRKCENMDFGDLRRFIDDSLQALSTGAGQEDLPREKKEFLELLKLLHAKLGETASSKTPLGKGPPPEPREFVPSKELEALRAKCLHLQNWLAEARRNGESHSRVIRILEQREKVCRRQAAARETREREDHEQRNADRLSSYEKARAAYRASPWRHASSVKRRVPASRQQEMIERLRRDIECAFSPRAVAGVERLPFNPLPPGELSADRLRRYYEGVQRRNPEFRYEPERLDRAFSLGPKKCYVGTDEFDGYAVFTFSHTERVLLECPVYGNAVYVIDKDWKRLVGMSKRDLLSAYPAEVTKIVHKGEWFAKVKLMLGIRR
jgi:hypothetical protein